MTNQHTQTCGIAAMLNLFGDRWSWLLVREAFYGANRFTQFQRNTGASRSILTSRLQALVENGVFKQVEIGTLGNRAAYELTEKGRALLPVLIAMSDWANTHEYGPGQEPVLHVSRDSALPITDLRFFDAAGAEVPLDRLTVEPGPGASSATIRRLKSRAENTV